MTMSATDTGPLRDAVVAAARGDSAAFVSAVDGLERRGWDDSAVAVMEALFNAVDELPTADPDNAAAITQRVSERFEGSLKVARPIMEAMIRRAGGEAGTNRGIPRDLGLVHSLLAVGQIVHEDYLTVDEALGHATPDEIPTDVPDHGN